MFCTPYTHLWSVGWLEAVGGGAGVPAVVLGGDAAEAEGGAALVEGGVALLVPLHLEYSIIFIKLINYLIISIQTFLYAFMSQKSRIFKQRLVSYAYK